MDIVRSATRVVTETANATTAAAGAVGGAAVNGIIGGVQGTAAGIRSGLGTGSHSTPAALLTLAAVGAAGLVEWPVLLTVGGTALLVRQLNRHDGGQTDTARPAKKAARPVKKAARPVKKAAKKSSPRKTTAPRSRSRASR
jgi:hypothetical protein